MTRIIPVLAIAAFSAATSGAFAQSAPRYVKAVDPAAASWVPPSAFFLGLGGSADAVDFGDQNVYAVGTSNVFLNGVQVNSGTAAGPATIGTPVQNRLAPVAQAGYYQKFSGSDWLWGVKASYSYLDSTASVANALLPQYGSFTATGSTVAVPFTGNAVVRSFQTKVDHQIALVPFVGKAFERSFVYLGAGPTVSHTRTNLNGLIGFADLTGQPSDVSGQPVNMTSNGWVVGGAAIIGVTYFLDRSWFVDLSYSYARTASQTANFSTPFTNPNGTNGTTNVGTMVGSSTENLTTQAVTVSINKAFEYR